MRRSRSGLAALVLALAAVGRAGAQEAISRLPNLVPNGGFQSGTRGWRVTIGPWGRGTDPWARARGIAEVVQAGGGHALRLNARHRSEEVDVSSEVLPVEAGKAYLLGSRVRQAAGEGGYKVVLDWMDSAGKHLSFSNDWRGNDHPKSFAFHGGVFVAPSGAAKVLVLLGVAKGAECLFDEIRLSPLPAGPAEPAPDGEGTLETRLPASVRAGGCGTFTLIYHAGPHGLPPGAAVEFRRDNINPRWSPPQASDPKGAGYVTAKASNGALCLVQPGSASQVPCVTRVVVVYPALARGDTLTITYGDLSGGGPGAKVQPTPETLRFTVGMDGNADGRALDLPDSPPFSVVPGPFARLGLIVPAVAEASKPFRVTIEARDRLGNRLAEPGRSVALATDDGAAPRRGKLAGGPLTATFRAPGLHTLRATSGGVSVQQRVLVTRKPADPPPASEFSARARTVGDTIVLENRGVRLLFPRNPFGYGIGFVEAHGAESWQRVGAFRSLGELRAGAAGSTPIWLGQARTEQKDGAARAVFSGRLAAGGTTWRASVECRLGFSAQHATFRCTVVPEEPGRLRAFYAPELLAGDGSFGRTKDGALFPGLEYLTAAEVSSGDYGSVPPLSERSVPHPFKVTMPLMAVVGDHACAMLFWDPHQAWDGTHRYPSARFESPARGGGDNHRLALFAPTIPQGLPENAQEMPKPISVRAGKPLTLELSVAALAPADDLTAAVRYWFDVHGVPSPPPTPRTWDDERQMLLTALMKSAYDPEKKGWHNALADPWGATYNPEAALLLWYHAATNPESARKADIDARLAEVWQAAGGASGFDLAFHRGDAAAALIGLQANGEGAAYGMSAEGAYAYHPHTGNQTFPQSVAKSLGRDGDINVGTCVMGLEPLMRAALMTGDPMLVRAGEKGLDYLRRFSRPQGAENWEVPLACPNLRAAALATRCCLYGYLITGKPDYLQRARYWAQTGLPFIYAWNADERLVMRYASISVMGTSLYTGGWFGNAVQWVGLVYADAIRELAPYDRDFPWAKVAEGILISAMQQQKTDKATCGHVGMYPDSYTPVKGDETYHWCLGPQPIWHLVNALHGLDARASAVVANAGDRPIPIVAAGRLADAAYRDGTLRFVAQYLPGRAHEVAVSRIENAAEVLVDGVTIPPLDPSAGDAQGWQRSPLGYLRLRLRTASGTARVELRGCTLMPLEAERDVAAISDGGFESGMLYWAPNPPERVRIVSDAHTGARAIELDAVGLPNEVQCSSRTMQVEGGKVYELSAWVKQVAGAGDYKVTIDWLGPDGHIAYANDWAGADRPTQYTLHGGRLAAPPGARIATVLLGVRAGSRYVFDDVSLREVR